MTWAGGGQVIDALRSLQRKSPGAGEITTAIGTVRSHRQRMRDQGGSQCQLSHRQWSQ